MCVCVCVCVYFYSSYFDVHYVCIFLCVIVFISRSNGMV